MQLGVPQGLTLSSWVARYEMNGAQGGAHGGHEACRGCADMTMLSMGLLGPRWRQRCLMVAAEAIRNGLHVDVTRYGLVPQNM